MSEDPISHALASLPSAPGALSPTARFVTQQVITLQELYVSGSQPTSYSRAALAQLRRGLGKPVGAIPDLLELTLDPNATDPGTGPGGTWHDNPTPEEVAAHTALTLYALHQQSRRSRMHAPGRPFGQAIGTLRFHKGEENEGVLRRFQALGTSDDIDELTRHAHSLISLLRVAEIGLDYGLFAEDLVRFQHPRRRDAVRLRWGRDFYRVTGSTPGTTDLSDISDTSEEHQS